MKFKITQNDSVVVIEFPSNPTLAQLNLAISNIKRENRMKKIMFMETQINKDGVWKLFTIFEF